MKLQTHVHSPCCRSHAKGKCHFHFPRPLSTKTIIARGVCDECNVNIDEKIGDTYCSWCMRELKKGMVLV